MPEQKRRYRYVTPTKKGRWHPTRRGALEAAVKAGEAHKDEWGTIFLSPLTRIESEDVK